MQKIGKSSSTHGKNLSNATHRLFWKSMSAPMRPSATLEKAICFVKVAFQFAKNVQQRRSSKTSQCHTSRCIMLSYVVQEWKTCCPKLKIYIEIENTINVL